MLVEDNVVLLSCALIFARRRPQKEVEVVVIFAKPDARGAVERGLARKTLLVRKGVAQPTPEREKEQENKIKRRRRRPTYGKRNKEYVAGQEAKETTREEAEGFVPTSESLVSSVASNTPKKIPNKNILTFRWDLNMQTVLTAPFPVASFNENAGERLYVQRTIPNA